MRITLVVWALHAGGAERVVANLANAWVAAGHAVTIVTLSPRTEDFYRLDDRVIRTNVLLHSRLPRRILASSVLGRLGQPGGLRCALRASRPDVVVSAINITNVKTIVASRGLNVPVVATEHIQPTEEEIGGFWRMARRASYPRADAVVMLTEDGAKWARSIVPAERVRVIPNFVKLPPGVPEHRGGARVLLSVGRMRPQKGFDLLLEAFATSQARSAGWTLRIVGDGPYRRSIVRLARDLEVDESVVFIGRTGNIWAEYARADVYVMASRFEGFPMVLLEAMAMGVPVVSFDCPTGPRELITDGVSGLLVRPEDVGSLAAAIDRLATDPSARAALAERGRVVAARYSPEAVLPLWSELLDSVVLSRSHQGR